MNQGKLFKNDNKRGEDTVMTEDIKVSEVRRVINQIMSYSSSEIKRWKDCIEAHKDDDPAVIAPLYIKMVEHTAEWNTAFLIANELSIRLSVDEQDKQRR